MADVYNLDDYVIKKYNRQIGNLTIFQIRFCKVVFVLPGYLHNIILYYCPHGHGQAPFSFNFKFHYYYFPVIFHQHDYLTKREK